MYPCARAIPFVCTAVLVETLLGVSAPGCGSRRGATQVASSKAAARAEIPRQGPTDPQELEAFVDSVLAREMEAEHVPGVAFVFVKAGRVFSMKGYGFANLERQRRVDPESTLFRIGSISKVFTATAVVQLADRGKLDLHADVNLALRRVQVPATFPQPVTAAHLLSHTAGLDEIRPGHLAADSASVQPLPNFLRSRLVRLWPPGQVPMYSTYGMTLAGELIEEISGLRYEEYMRANIWRPLGMARTCVDVPPALAPDVAMGYEYRAGVNQPQAWEWYNTTPASSINSTAADMARFLIAHLHDGAYGDARILSERAARDMHARHSAGDPSIAGFAYGFVEALEPGYPRWIEHGGDMAGFSAQIVLIPEADTGFFFVGQHESSPLRDALKGAILKRYYYSDASRTTPRISTELAATTERFVGSYGWNCYCHTCPGRAPGFVLDVTRNSDGSLNLNGKRWVPTERRHFVRDDGMAHLAFRTNADGRPTHLLAGGFWVFERMP